MRLPNPSAPKEFRLKRARGIHALTHTARRQRELLHLQPKCDLPHSSSAAYGIRRQPPRTGHPPTATKRDVVVAPGHPDDCERLGGAVYLPRRPFRNRQGGQLYHPRFPPRIPKSLWPNFLECL